MKISLVISIYKRGDINYCNKHRDVVLLAMGSSILVRILADRIRILLEAKGLLDEEQAEFWEGLEHIKCNTDYAIVQDLGRYRRFE